MIVVDANILMRPVLGKRTRTLLAKYSDRVELVAPDVAFQNAADCLPDIIARRNLPAKPFMEYVESVAESDDWPILATALAFGCPIWTEDNDLFGCGVATWTSDRVEVYLAEVCRD